MDKARDEAERRLVWILSPVLGSVFLVMWFAFGHMVTRSKPVPNRRELGRVTPGHQKLRAVWPYGRCHELVLGIPGSEGSRPPAFTASIKMADEDQVVTALAVHYTNVVHCNWLHSPDVQGFILTWPNTNDWDRLLMPGRTYSILCDFEGNIPTNSTLWVSSLQTVADRAKTKRIRTAQ